MVGYTPIKSLQQNSRFIYFLFREDGFLSDAFNAHIIKMGCPLNKKTEYLTSVTVEDAKNVENGQNSNPAVSYFIL